MEREGQPRQESQPTPADDLNPQEREDNQAGGGGSPLAPAELRDNREGFTRRPTFDPLPEPVDPRPPDQNGTRPTQGKVAIPAHQMRPFLKAGAEILDRVAPHGMHTLHIAVPDGHLTILTTNRQLGNVLLGIINAWGKEGGGQAGQPIQPAPAIQPEQGEQPTQPDQPDSANPPDPADSLTPEVPHA